jgi:Fungal specific transcription factor domain
MPPAPESRVDSMDLQYLGYWLREMPKNHPFATPFPSFLTNLFQISVSNPHLRHSLVSLAAFVADNSHHRPLVRALLHHQETLRKVQGSLTLGTITESTIYAVMMLAYFNVFTGKFLSARRHIRGLSLLLEQFSAQGSQPSATTMLIWRCGVRIDYILSSVYPCKPIFPPPPMEQEDLHRSWIRNCVVGDEEWALGQFALDNLQSKAAHLSWQASQLRKGDGMLCDTEEAVQREAMIQRACAALIDEMTTWRERRVFVEEEAQLEMQELLNPECQLSGDESSQEGTFLRYPRMNTGNAFYESLLNEYRSAVLFVTFIASPRINHRSQYTQLRLLHAIDICRSLAVSGQSSFPVPMVRFLQLAGLVFGNRQEFPEQCSWIEDQLDKVSGRGVIGANKVKEMLQIVWTSEFQWSYDDTERWMQSEDDLEQLELEEGYDTVR